MKTISAILAIVFIFSYSAPARAIGIPPPPEVKILNSKTSHDCLELSESWLRTKPINTTELASMGKKIRENRAVALGIHNACDMVLTITKVETTKQLSVIAWTNQRRFELRVKGSICEASADNKALKVLKNLSDDSASDAVKYKDSPDGRDDPPPVCSSVLVADDNDIDLAIPTGQDFEVTGMLGDSPIKISGKLIDPNNPEQSMDYFRKAAAAGDAEAKQKLEWLEYIVSEREKKK